MSPYRMLMYTLPGFGLIAVFAIILLSQPLSLVAAPPDLSLAGLDGKPHALSEYIGKGTWTLVNIWGPRCPPCQEELPELVRFHDEHHQNDATVLGIALDYPSFGSAKVEEVAAFTEDYLVGFPVLLGNDETFAQFGAGPLQGMPTSLVYTPDGELAAVQVGMITQEIIEKFMRNYQPE